MTKVTSFGVLEHIMLMNVLSVYEGSYGGSNKHTIYGYTTAKKTCICRCVAHAIVHTVPTYIPRGGEYVYRDVGVC